MRKKLYLAASLALSAVLLFQGTVPFNSSYAKTKLNVKLSKTKVTLNKGKSYKLKVTVSGVKKANITFKSSKTAVASVNKSGKISAKKAGKAKITVTVKKGKDTVKKTCHVTVKQTSTSQSEPTFAPEIKKATENNPILTNCYVADPAVMEYNGRIYVYMTNDSQHYERGEKKESNTYEYIQSLHIISTDDMVNWTDHGTFQIAAANTKDKFGTAKWAGCCWAPCAAYKKIDGKDKFFIYFTNGGYQIGVVEADSPAGPFTDPVGKALVGPFSANESTTGALDPSIFTDDDGTTYLCYGNGELDEKGKNGARIRKLAEDMISFDGPEITIDAPYFFEDSGINKIGDTYYFSYCSNWSKRSEQYSDLGLCSIGYMTSKSPEGPYEYKGDVLENCGNVFGVVGNNHHSIIKFNDKYYMFYHTRVLETALGSDLGFRSSHVNELTVNADGTLEPVKQDLTGVSQIKAFNPYEETKGTTYSDCSGMVVTRYLVDGAYMEAVSEPDKYQYSWSLIKGADFGTTSPSKFVAHFKMEKNKTAKIKVYADKLGKDVIAEADIVPDENGDAAVSVSTQKITGTHNIYFAFDGAVQSFEDWKFEK